MNLFKTVISAQARLDGWYNEIPETLPIDIVIIDLI